ncbi:unnamed protein product, partial [Allacma fusca]
MLHMICYVFIYFSLHWSAKCEKYPNEIFIEEWVEYFASCRVQLYRDAGTELAFLNLKRPSPLPLVLRKDTPVNPEEITILSYSRYTDHCHANLVILHSPHRTQIVRGPPRNNETNIAKMTMYIPRIQHFHVIQEIVHTAQKATSRFIPSALGITILILLLALRVAGGNNINLCDSFLVIYSIFIDNCTIPAFLQKRLSRQIIVGVSMFLSIIATNSYRGKITATMTVPKPIKTLERFDDLHNFTLFSRISRNAAKVLKDYTWEILWASGDYLTDHMFLKDFGNGEKKTLFRGKEEFLKRTTGWSFTLESHTDTFLIDFMKYLIGESGILTWAKNLPSIKRHSLNYNIVMKRNSDNVFPLSWKSNLISGVCQVSIYCLCISGIVLLLEVIFAELCFTSKYQKAHQLKSFDLSNG